MERTLWVVMLDDVVVEVGVEVDVELDVDVVSETGSEEIGLLVERTAVGGSLIGVCKSDGVVEDDAVG